jgi:hypothetical protein
MIRQQSYLTYAARHTNGLVSRVATDYLPAAPAEGRGWQADAVASYQAALDQERPLATTLAARIYTLSGRVVSPEAVFVDHEAGRAAVVVDGVTFRMRAGQVVILRSCVECGLGHIESAPLATRADLGYALSAWEPRHPGCEEEDPANWLEI